MPLLPRPPPDADSTVVARLEAAGAVLLGTARADRGRERRPPSRGRSAPQSLELRRSPGGSSSGSGVAAAAGLCFGAIGSDTAGSIRIPSSWCGIAGLKPTWGRVSRFGVFPLAETLDCIGPMARRVGDLAAMLAVLAGADASDPTAARAVRSRTTSPCSQDGIAGVRIGVDEAYVTERHRPGAGEAQSSSRPPCSGSSAPTSAPSASPTSGPRREAGTAILAIECARAHEEWFPARADEYGPHLRETIEDGRSLDGDRLRRVPAGARDVPRAARGVLRADRPPPLPGDARAPRRR